MGKLLRFGVMAAVIALPLIAGNGCKAEQQSWPLWDSYVKGFIDDQGRVIDHSGSDRTTSEAQAYAMFFALVDNDRAHFDKLLAWTQNNLAHGDMTRQLPAWSWGKAPDGSWRVLDTNPASDADLWMAYDLLEAGRLWGSDSYTKLGQSMADHIAHQEVQQLPQSCASGPLLLPAPAGFHTDDYTWILNPSYAPLPLLQYMAKTFPSGPWGAMVQELPSFYNNVATAGYVPDWAKCDSRQGWMPSAAPSQGSAQGAVGQATQTPAPASPSTAQPAPATAPPAPPPAIPMGSYDAVRVYLWLGIADPSTPGVRDSLENFPAMANYLSKQYAPPLTVDNYGSVKNADGPLGFSAAVIPYLQAMNMKSLADAQQKRLASGWNSESGLYGYPPHYYDQNLALFANGWMEKRYRMDKDGRLKLKWK